MPDRELAEKLGITITGVHALISDRYDPGLAFGRTRLTAERLAEVFPDYLPGWFMRPVDAGVLAIIATTTHVCVGVTEP